MKCFFSANWKEQSQYFPRGPRAQLQEVASSCYCKQLPRNACPCVCACMPICPHTRSKFCFYPSDRLDKQNEYLGNNSSILFENFSLDIQSNLQVKIPTCSHLFIILSVKGSLCQAVRSSTNNNLLPCGLSWVQTFVIFVRKCLEQLMI